MGASVPNATATPLGPKAANHDVAGNEAELYRRMRIIRRFEEIMLDLLNADEIAGTAHECIGQEAVAVGACAALRANDAITSTHRGHGHALAKGTHPKFAFAELMGRSTGTNRGRGGSMHLTDVAHGNYGANGIVAAGAPIATGLAWAFKRKRTDRVALSFFGDGALNQGVLLETLNIASLWSLPVVFVCENNHYAVTIRDDQSTAGTAAGRAAAFEVPAVAVDGMDVVAVRDATVAAVEHARAGHGPTLVECDTCRFSGHHAAERYMNLQYRSDQELADARARDPLLRTAERLGEQSSEQINQEVEHLLSEALEFARNAPRPDPKDATAFAYASGMKPRLGWE